ncbi:hypothetical protein A1O1_01055 [Capronia coronata CBS 617.96]|uniref:Prenyltransferase alpha-alpha toroid domain-containing protein n=1 Tax=Capronia coronata CBS 617.96 TaxID=1182541 RepID=W9Z1W9_9EURO|nr:uncharacterized protein A1O1_01055 [Capronia coronata CBS 617.96]EXJ95930.1 hypothetical protein A1O1_01055 [Capronia coronata CBS 617.96]
MIPEKRTQLDRERHIKYWKRCSQLLPEPYTSGEASRMSFGFFIVAALDLLGALEKVTTPDERQSWIEWIYTCQVPHTGGFRGFTGTMLGGMRSPQNWHWDPANLPNTYFALATLVILGDDLQRVQRRQCIAWVRSLQRKNGSFGEFLGENNDVEGADDPRLCLCAVGTLKILQADEQDLEIDETKLQQFIANCQSYEGGIGQAPLLEAHSGLNYCGIATLSFLGLLHSPVVSIREVASQAGLDVPSCVCWMLDRQTTWIDDAGDDSSDEEDETERQEHTPREAEPEKELLDLPSLMDGLSTDEAAAGFCGRCGKMADTCYCFWNVGALAILQQHHLVDIEAVRRYLLEHVSHLIGGFGKAPGELPGVLNHIAELSSKGDVLTTMQDLLHSYLGLATLAIYNEPGLKEYDPTFCFSKEAVEKIQNASWRRY